MPRDVGEDRDAIAFLDQPHRHTRASGLDRHAGFHQRQRTAADGGHRRRPIRLENLRDDPDRVREVGRGREEGMNRPLRQRTVANFATRRAAQRPDFTGGVRREVVVEHERLLRLARHFDRIDPLLVVGGAEGDGHERLRLTASEHGGAVHAGDDAPTSGVMARMVSPSRPSMRSPLSRI